MGEQGKGLKVLYIETLSRFFKKCYFLFAFLHTKALLKWGLHLLFACWVVLHAFFVILIFSLKLTFSKKSFKNCLKKSFRNTVRVSNSLDPDQAV